MSKSDRGCYVYCVVRESADLSLSGLVGVAPGFDVATVTYRGLSAVVSEVPLQQFGADALKDNFEDLEWLERTARAHDAILARALAADAVVPLRLCTIFTDEAGVRRMLERGREFLLDVLGRLRCKAEWSVKLLADQKKIESAAREHESARAAAPAAGGSEAPGRAFFARKKAERRFRRLGYKGARRKADFRSDFSAEHDLFRRTGFHFSGSCSKKARPHRSLAFVIAQTVFRFSAADLPVLRSTTTSNATRWPSRSSRRPARSTALIWTNTSLPPPSGWIKP